MFHFPCIIVKPSLNRLFCSRRCRRRCDTFLGLGRRILLLKNLGINDIACLDRRGRPALPGVVVQRAARARKETTCSTVLSVANDFLSTKADIPRLGLSCPIKRGVKVAHYPQDIAFLQPKSSQIFRCDIWENAFVHGILDEVLGIPLTLVRSNTGSQEEIKPIIVGLLEGRTCSTANVG